jgi:serine/threonine-protein kinase
MPPDANNSHPGSGLEATHVPSSSPSGAPHAPPPVHDLTRDPLIANAPRISMEGRVTPCLGGIPLLSRLGQGGMGAVYYGIHPRLNKEVAVKVLPFHLAEQQPDLVKRFFREAQIASRVQSPHLVSVADVNQEGGLFFLVMEYVSGKSAGAHLRLLRQQGLPGLSETDALDVCIAAATGLAAAHAEGVVHRDIKPDNILIPMARKKGGHTGSHLNFNAAKLADLGLARSDDFTQSMTGNGTCMGTPGYMSPEQITDAKSVGGPGDVFSMGATLYALLSGQAPFQGSALIHVLLATQQQPHVPIWSLRADVSQATSQLIQRCLEKIPAQRFADGGDLLEALKTCRAALPKHPEKAPAPLPPASAAQSATGASQTTLPPPLTPTAPATPAPPLFPTLPAAQTPAPAPARMPAPMPPWPVSARETAPVPPAASSAANPLAAVVLLLAAIGAGVYFYTSRNGSNNTTAEPLRMETPVSPEPVKLQPAPPPQPDPKTGPHEKPQPEKPIILKPMDELLAERSAPKLGQRHVEIEGGFSYCPPADWAMYEMPGMKYKLFRLAKGNFANNVVAESITTPGSTQDDVVSLRTNNPRLYQDYVEHSLSEFTTDTKIAGQKLEISGIMFGNKLRQSFYFLPAASNFRVVLTYTCLDADAETCRPLFDASARSFRPEK